MFKAQNNIFKTDGGKCFVTRTLKTKKRKKDKETEIKRTMVSGGGGQKSL